MAMRPPRPCKHPGCAALTREGWCEKHKPEPRPTKRGVSAAYHGWYSKPIWVKRLRPDQLSREPFCRVCAGRHPDPGNGRRPHRGFSRELGSVRLPDKSPEPVQVPPRPEDSARAGSESNRNEALIRREATSALKRERRSRRTGAHGGVAATLPPPRESFGVGPVDRDALSGKRKSP